MFERRAARAMARQELLYLNGQPPSMPPQSGISSFYIGYPGLMRNQQPAIVVAIVSYRGLHLPFPIQIKRQPGEDQEQTDQGICGLLDQRVGHKPRRDDDEKHGDNRISRNAIWALRARKSFAHDENTDAAERIKNP